MTTDRKFQQFSVRDLDPNVLQRRASAPQDSVWVSASAGAGKTKVLTDRVLRLLLPQSESQPGCAPHKILCLTFTKAAASEMALRIQKVLSRWAVMPEDALAQALKKLQGRDAFSYEIRAARKLFADIIDDSGGLQIMTIHSFCQSVLGRFPLEAGLTPGFHVLEDADASALLRDAKARFLIQIQAQDGHPLQEALHNIAGLVNEDQFLQLLGDIQKERYQFLQILEQNFGNVEGLYQNICKVFDIPSSIKESDFIAGCYEQIDLEAVDTAVCVLQEGTEKTDQPKADQLRGWLDFSPEGRIENFDLYKGVFLTQKNEIRKTLITKKLAEAFPATENFLQEQAENLKEFQDKIARLSCARLTRDLLLLAEGILENYQDLKTRQGVLDFDDLILKTLYLLEGRFRPDLHNMQGWVHYKLDQGLDHILVDEAQDTNPQQWKIIEALCDDFFSGDSARAYDASRTVFVVGDEKQSIYSFQRASPEEFSRMRKFFAGKISDAGQPWSPVDLNISFRSSPSVLKAVDHIFSDPFMAEGLGLDSIQHHSYRRGQAGLVELWPLCAPDEPLPVDPWEPPVEVFDMPSGSAMLAEKIADQIWRWIDSQDILESYNRPIQPGDIMILLRTRNVFLDQLTRALKRRGLPISGSDRMVLNNQLAVQDMLALAEFALLPEDDLTLACLLKLPLIGLREDDLFKLCHGRSGSLWNALQDSDYKHIFTYLKALRARARAAGAPYAFFSWALQNPCPGDERSGWRAFTRRLGHEAIEILEELLNIALRYETDHGVSLQQFVSWQKSNAAEIKREMEGRSNAIRIMTVHASKGLQAPIVILPDTTRSSRHAPNKSAERLLWPDKTGLDIPIWAAHKDLEFSLFREKFDVLESRSDQEYRRLLYVAMTRAEDRLYIAGYKEKKEPIADSWHTYIAQRFASLDGVQALEDGRYRLTNPQIHEPDRAEDFESAKPDHKDLPAWALHKPASEPDLPQPFAPSRASNFEPSGFSPLKSSERQRFKRGNLTHKLLQVLPDLDVSKRAQAGAVYLKNFAGDLDDDTRGEILDEVLCLLNHPEFAPLFRPGSLAEVCVSGLLDENMLLSGQIDRLCISDDMIWIIDYKTNRAPPDTIDDVPGVYLEQMRSYHRALVKIYPGRTIKSALLWTQGPVLMPLDFENS